MTSYGPLRKMPLSMYEIDPYIILYDFDWLLIYKYLFVN